MRYKRDKNVIYVFRMGHWRVLRRHVTEVRARVQFAALRPSFVIVERPRSEEAE